MKWILQHAAPYGVSAAPYGVSATPYGVSAGVLALQDTHGTLRGGGLLHMKNFYGLELLKNHF